MTVKDLQDGGERKEYATGAVREPPTGKGRFDLITPIGLRRLAVIYELGGVKYPDRNWEQGIPMSRLLDSAIRHLNQYKEGHRDEDHLAQAAWNCFAAMHVETMVERQGLPDDLMDVPSYLREPASDAD